MKTLNLSIVAALVAACAVSPVMARVGEMAKYKERMAKIALDKKTPADLTRKAAVFKRNGAPIAAEIFEQEAARQQAKADSLQAAGKTPVVKPVATHKPVVTTPVVVTEQVVQVKPVSVKGLTKRIETLGKLSDASYASRKAGAWEPSVYNGSAQEERDVMIVDAMNTMASLKTAEQAPKKQSWFTWKNALITAGVFGTGYFVHRKGGFKALPTMVSGLVAGTYGFFKGIPSMVRGKFSRVPAVDRSMYVDHTLGNSSLVYPTVGETVNALAETAQEYATKRMAWFSPAA